LVILGVFLAEDNLTTFRIDVPLKRDLEIEEARRREFLTKVLYALGGVLVLALFVFVAYRFMYPY